MNRRFFVAAAVALVAITSVSVRAGVLAGTAFTYQGEVLEQGVPLDGTADMTFRLFDLPAGEGQVGSDQVIADVPISDGVFTVTLDFGNEFSTTAARFLEIEVNGTVLSPRQLITAAPFSIFSQNTRGVNVDSTGDVSIGTTASTYQFQVHTEERSRAIYGNNLNTTTGAKYGVYGRATAPTGYGVYGLHDATSGTNAGVYGETDSTAADAVGVHGVVDSTSPGSFSAAVRGENRGTGSTGIGVWGSQEGGGWGVYGTTEGGLTGRGVYGAVTGSGGYAGYFANDGGVALLADGTDNNGSIAALQVTSGGQTMYIDGNEIDSDWSEGVFLNRNSANNVVLAAGGGDVLLPDNATVLDVSNDVEVGGQMRGAFVVAGYNSADGALITTRGNSDIGNIVTHIRFEATGVSGTISSLNGTVSYNAFTGSHYVAVDSAVEPGTLMRMTGANRRLAGGQSSEPVYGVEATRRANDPACLGAYFSAHGDLYTADGRSVHLVSAVGNGALKVVDDGRGDIAPGDLLISSHLPGHAMKDDPARFATGYIIARAAEGIVWADVATDADGRKRALISVLFDAGVRTAPAEQLELARRVDEQRAIIEHLQQRLAALESSVGTERYVQR